MKLLHYLFSGPVALFGLFFRRQSNHWALIISRHQNFEGNIATLAHYLLERKDCHVYLLSYRPSFDASRLRHYPGLTLIQAGSWAEFWLRMRCRHVVISHSTRPALGLFAYLRGVQLINVWHGIPIKCMGNMNVATARNKLSSISKHSSFVDMFTVSSELERTMMAACDLMDATKLRITGIPRTDVFLCSSKRDTRQHQIIAEVTQLKNGRPLVLYAPTFRDYDRSACGLDRATLESIDALAAQYGFIFAVRTHPRDRDLYNSLIGGLTNIISADAGRWEDANSVLCATDMLISDYSSIWIDYLLLRRPVCAHLWDEDTYREKRGFLLNLAAIFPGPVVRNHAALLDALVDAAKSGFQLHQYTDIHTRMTALFHQYQDGKSCERIYQAAMERR